MARFYTVLFAIVLLMSSIAQAQDETPMLDHRSLDNLVAFTQVWGYIQHFYPSDAVVATDWDDFAIAYIESVEQAQTPQDLAQQLNQLFQPYAPSIAIYPTDDSAITPETNMPQSLDAVTMWVHSPRVDWQQDEFTYGQRITIALEDGKLPESTSIFLDSTSSNVRVDIINPETIFRYNLAGGVTLAMPHALYHDTVGTIPTVDIDTLSLIHI